MSDGPSELARVLGPPQSISVDWVSVERELGFLPPPDYRYYAEHYPALSLQAELRIWHPASSESEANLLGIGKVWTAELHEMWTDDPELYPYPMYPEPGGLFAWGDTSEGAGLYWKTDDWQVIVMSREEEGWAFDGTFTDLLVRQLDGTLDCPLFSEVVTEQQGSAAALIWHP